MVNNKTLPSRIVRIRGVQREEEIGNLQTFDLFYAENQCVWTGSGAEGTAGPR